MYFFYKFDNTITPGLDSSGNNKTATVNGSPAQVTSYAPSAGSALQLNGTTQYVTTPVINFPSTANGITISIWVKIANNSTGYIPLVNDHNNNDNYVLVIGIDANISSALPCQVSFYDGNSINGSKNLCDNQWHNITVTTTVAGSIKLYTDGKQDAPAVSGSATAVPSSVTSTWIGRDDGTSQEGQPAYAPGSIDDVMLFGANLSLSQVQKIYALGAAKHGITLK